MSASHQDPHIGGRVLDAFRVTTTTGISMAGEGGAWAMGTPVGVPTSFGTSVMMPCRP